MFKLKSVDKNLQSELLQKFLARFIQKLCCMVSSVRNWGLEKMDNLKQTQNAVIIFEMLSFLNG